MAFDPRAPDPDTGIVALFRYKAMENQIKSRAEGRKIFDNVEVCEMRFPGRADLRFFPAHDFSHWITDEYGQRQITYAERFKRQYQQFLDREVQTKSGTPLDEVHFLTEAKKAELKAQNVYTVEILADIEGQALKNLGPGGREMKNQAIEFMTRGRETASGKAMQAEIDALKAKAQILEEDNALLKQQRTNGNGDQPGAAEFINMSIEQLREYITVNSGHAPLGSLNKKSLQRMAEDCRPKMTV